MPPKPRPGTGARSSKSPATAPGPGLLRRQSSKSASADLEAGLLGADVPLEPRGFTVGTLEPEPEPEPDLGSLVLRFGASDDDAAGGGGGGGDSGDDESSRAEIVAACILHVALCAWLLMALWTSSGDNLVIDSSGGAHTIRGTRLTTNEIFFFYASCCWLAQLVSAQLWLTMSAIARKHKLDHAGAVADKGYGMRLEAASEEAKVLTKAERAQLWMLSLDFLCGSWAIFWEAWDESFIIMIVGVCMGVGPGFVAWAAWGKLVTVARSKALEKQRVRSVQFAATAFRGTMGAAMLQAVFLVRFAVLAVNMPSDPLGAFMIDEMCFQPNLDSATNDTWALSASITECTADLFEEALSFDSSQGEDVTVHSIFLPLVNQFLAALNIMLYLDSTIVFCKTAILPRFAKP